MTLRVAWRIDNAQTRNDLIARFDRFHLVLDRRIVAPCSGDEARSFGRQTAHGVIAMPEIPFSACNEEGCVRYHQLIEFVHRAPKMIGMAMRENHLVNLGLV